MRKMINDYGNMMFIGTGDEIKAVWKSLNRHVDQMSFLYGWFSEYLDCPRFNAERMYGIEFNAETQYYHIIGPRIVEDFLCR